MGLVQVAPGKVACFASNLSHFMTLGNVIFEHVARCTADVIWQFGDNSVDGSEEKKFAHDNIVCTAFL